MYIKRGNPPGRSRPFGSAERCGLLMVKNVFSVQGGSASEDPALEHQASATPERRGAQAGTRAWALETRPGQSIATGDMPATEHGHWRHACTRARTAKTCLQQSQRAVFSRTLRPRPAGLCGLFGQHAAWGMLHNNDCRPRKKVNEQRVHVLDKLYI